MVREITFNSVNINKQSNATVCYVSGEGAYNSPARVYDVYDVPGRNGALTIDRGKFENIEVSYHCFLFGDTRQDLLTKYENLKKTLYSAYGYVKITDSKLNGYRLGVLMSGLDVEPKFYDRTLEFDLVFNCKPQIFETETQTSYNSGTHTITNPTPFKAPALIQFNGTGSFSINGKTVTINIPSAKQTTTYFDTETLEAYTSTESYNSYFTIANDDLLLNPGNNTLVVSGVTQFKMTPRYWRV